MVMLIMDHIKAFESLKRTSSGTSDGYNNLYLEGTKNNTPEEK